MQLTLKVIEGSRHGMEVPVPGPKFFVGRDEDCHLRPQSDMVSRHHCVLLVEPGYVAVRDFGSKNGTYVNGQRIEGEQQLKAGDTLVIGPLHFEVVIQHVIGGPKLPKVKDIKDAVGRTSQRAAEGEVDVADWLIEDETVVGGPSPRDTIDADSSRVRLGEEAVGDTREMNAETPTDFVPKHEETTRIDPPALTQPAAEEGKEEEEEEGGRFAASKPAKTKDTQSAAVDVLRQMRKQQQEQAKAKAAKK